MNSSAVTILVVDDVPENVTLVQRILEFEGYLVETAADGREGLAVLARTNIDLAVVDINMPVIDGIAMLKQMRADEITKFVPVIMLTAMDDNKTTMECVRLGASGYVTKPFDRKALLRQIENCIGKPGTN